MSETNYFIAAGDSLDVVNRFRAWWESGCDAIDAVKAEFVKGDIVCVWASTSYVFGFGMRQGGEVPKGLRIDKKQGTQTIEEETVAIVVPDLRTKKGREIDKKLNKTRRGDSTDLARMLGLNSLFAGPRGYRMPGIGLEQLGDDWILAVDEDYEFEPPGAIPMKRSDYWTRKEAHERAEENAA